MKKASAQPKRAFVSPSARQRRRKHAIHANSSGVVNGALRELEVTAFSWPVALTLASHVPTSRDDLCAAYTREAAGPSLLRDCLVRTEDHVLIVVRHGDLVVESSQCPLAVKQGDSAIVPAGWWRITELPPAHSLISYWIIFFSPALIRTVVGDWDLPRQAAAQVFPAFSGVYVQRNLSRTLSFHGFDGPVPNVEKTFRAIAAQASAIFFMFLQKHYYAPRDAMEQLVRTWMRSNGPIEQLGVG